MNVSIRRHLTRAEFCYIGVVIILLSAVVWATASELRQRGERAIVAEAHANEILAALVSFEEHTGLLPKELNELTRRTEAKGVVRDPFLAMVPSPPMGWDPYQYTKDCRGISVFSKGVGGWSVRSTKMPRSSNS